MKLQEKEEIAKSLDALKKNHFDQVLAVKLALTKANIHRDSDIKKKLKAWIDSWENLINGVAEKSL